MNKSSVGVFLRRNNKLTMANTKSYVYIKEDTHLTDEQRCYLKKNADSIVAAGKGILAADESTGTIGKRFSEIALQNTEENRRAYRDLLFSAGKDLSHCLGGVILYEETLYQKDASGKPFVNVLKELGINPGIKVDKGVQPLNGNPFSIILLYYSYSYYCYYFHFYLDHITIAVSTLR